MTKLKEVRVITRLPQHDKYVPGIRIQGAILKEAGLDYGDKVRVKASPGQITIQYEA
jgi:hypothetical protein